MIWTAHTVESNGITLHYLRGGKSDAPPIIMLHGITDNGLCWDRVARVLAEDYDVILPDARGHGKSDKPTSGYSYADLAADVMGLIDALDIAPPVVFGHSMGGGTATVFAATYPDHVRALVLEDPAWLDDPQPDDEGREAWLNDWQAWLVKSKTIPLDELIAQQAAEAPDWDESELGPWAESKHAFSLDAFQLTHQPAVNWREVVPTIQCPFLLVTADVERGGIVTPAVAAAVESLPMAQIAHITGAGHSIHREAYDTYMVAITAFFASLPE
ncbi:MAG: alpha/beta hydrolase [Anaerolineae bacterium]|nr:alpha/beta hydrolase [Anaerolineae bacterium]